MVLVTEIDFLVVCNVIVDFANTNHRFEANKTPLFKFNEENY